MFLAKFILLNFIILNVNYVLSFPNDIIYLRDHFITNLLEENREKFTMKLTDEIRDTINMKIDAFFNVIDDPKGRNRRDTNDLLLNEKTTDVSVLKGFERRGIVPINFPQDICMFRINEKSFAVGLSFGRQPNTENILEIFKRSKGTFHKVMEYKSKYLKKIDCRAVNNIGYIAVVNLIESEMKPDELLKQGSFVYRIGMSENGEIKIDKLQTFAEFNQLAVRLWSRDKNLYLVYSYNTDANSPIEKCTVFKLTGSNFNAIDSVPCQNARIIEFFTVNHDLMLLIGNYRENNGTTNAFSTILRYDLAQRHFIEHQKLYTNAISVGKYFFLDHENQRQHFLFIGNSYEINEFGVVNYEVLSIIYKLVDGFFIPLQTINVKHVQDVAPVLSKSMEFHLLITSEEREVQIYYYDGWKFHESTLDFTGNVFSSGVVSMRYYDDIIDNTTTIVLSNINSNENQWNIYTPVYVKRNDSSKLKSSITKWCADTFAKLDEFNVDEADEVLKAAINLIDPTSDRVSFIGKVFIRNSTIQTINANELKRRNSTFNGKSIQRINEMSIRAQQLEKNVKKLKEKIDFTKASGRIRRQISEDTLIKTLIVENSIKLQTINGQSVKDIVYKSNIRNPGLKVIHANEVAIKKELFVDGKIDGIEMSEDNIMLNIPSQILRPMSFNHLNLERIEAQNVNNLAFNEFFTLLRRKVDHKMPNMIHQLDVDVLNVGELLNGRNFTAISINSLKLSGNQFINAPMQIENLQANGVMFEKDIRKASISNVSISHLINIKDTKPIDILQDIQFVQDVKVNKLFVKERVDNIDVVDDQFQVLRKRGSAEQVITGEKSFDIVNLKEPIVLRGKIESKTLEKMNPIVTIDKNLELQGDYVITGPVTIRRFINATENIVVANNENLSLRKLTESGLNLFKTTSTKGKLIFQDAIEVKNNLNAQSINDITVNSFIKSNYDKEQLVSGQKIFKNNLLVSGGTVQADVINDVDLRLLNNTILKRFSPIPQFIDGNIEFKDFEVDEITATTVKMNDKDINKLLTTNTQQNLKNVKANGIKALNFKAINVDQTNGAKVLGADLGFTIDDTITKESFDDSFIASKSFSNLKVQSLLFSDKNEWKSIIGNFTDMIVQDFNVTGSHVFKNQMKIGNIQVNGKINGIRYEDMTQNWLQIEGDQMFTETQTVKSINVDGDIKLNEGLINNVKLDKLIEESVWIDATVDVDSIETNGDIWANEKILAPSVNGASFGDRLIRNNSNEHQKLHKLKISNDCELRHLEFDIINGINYTEFMNVFNGNEGTVNLNITGEAIFNHPPDINFLNNINLKELYDNVWISNRDVILTGDNITFGGVNTIEKLLYTDTLNDKDLDYYNANYLSKSQDQYINGNLNVIGTVTAKRNFYVAKTIVPKFIHIDEHTMINIDEFSNSIMRQNVTQQISDFRVKRLIIHGDYDGLINGMNIQSDLLHVGNFETAVVTGHKKISYLNAFDINTQFVNEVDVKYWMENAVMLNSSHEQVIEGHVIFKQPVYIDNNLQVYGTVNGIRISPENILTKSTENQVINGDVTIKIMPPEGARMNQVLIENMKLNNGINGKNWNSFVENVFTRDTDYINSKRVVFEKELHMNSVSTNKSIYGTDIGEFLMGSSSNNRMIQFRNNMQYLSKVGDDLMRSLSTDVVELSHYEHHQTISGTNIKKTILFSIPNHHQINYILGIHQIIENPSTEIIKFYHWNRETQQFVIDDSMVPLQYNLRAFEVKQFQKIVYRGVDHLFVELFDRSKKTHLQYLYVYDVVNKILVPVIQSESPNTAKFFTWKDGSLPCYGSMYYSSENVFVDCEGKLETIIKTKPLKKIKSENDILILLTVDDMVQVWHNEKFHNLPQIINPQSFTSVRYNDKIYIALRSDKFEGTVHHGYINILVSPTDNIKFEHLQKLSLNIPSDVQFSIIPSGDLMLYVLTRNPTKALSIYTYAGNSNFIESTTDTTIVSEASDLDVINIDGNIQVLSIVSGDNVYIIQAVLMEY